MTVRELTHPKIAAVNYLGFLAADDPRTVVFKQQCESAGSTFGFAVKGGEAEASYVDARTPQGEDIDRASCVSALSRRAQAP